MPEQIPFSLYIHIPYCRHKCPYCDFNTYAVARIPEQEYVQALLAELDFRLSSDEWRGRRVQSIYFGGGTPSLFSSESIDVILRHISARSEIESALEVTIEANPGTVNAESLESYRKSGVNRLSLGAQSFTPGMLENLGRVHTAEETVDAVRMSRSAGFDNLSLDIIYALPGQTLEDFEYDLSQLILLSPEHISAYGLTIEQGTPFYQAYSKGGLSLPREDVEVEMMTRLNSTLEKNNYLHYEISNFAREGMYSRHNSAYWNGDDYLGLGAGAHSFVRKSAEGGISGVRWSNFAQPEMYMKRSCATGHAESWKDSVSQRDARFEFFFLGLRKIEGVSKSEYEGRFGEDVDVVYGSIINDLTRQGLLLNNNGILKLTSRGLLLADSVIENFADISYANPAESCAGNF